MIYNNVDAEAESFNLLHGYALAQPDCPSYHFSFYLPSPHSPLPFRSCPFNQVLAINNAAIQRLLLACHTTPTHALHSRNTATPLPLPLPFPLSLPRHFWQFVQNQSSATNAMQQQEQLTRHNCHIRRRRCRRRLCRRRGDATRRCCKNPPQKIVQ